MRLRPQDLRRRDHGSPRAPHRRGQGRRGVPRVEAVTGGRPGPATGDENGPAIRADRAMPGVPGPGEGAEGRDVAGARVVDAGPGAAVRRVRRGPGPAVGAVNRDETCARCGHTSNGCARCRRMDPFLGAVIDGKPYCHAFSPTTPSCYTQAMREQDHDQRSTKGVAVRGDYRNPRGQCPSCDEWKAVRQDGMIMRHSFGGRYSPCSGSLCPPKQIIRPK